ncbi:MAG TPA: hypothetical protein VGJ05_06670 [Fimbriiglobus sp.]|jgi:hypothetical protein
MTKNVVRRLAILGACCGVVGVADGQPPTAPAISTPVPGLTFSTPPAGSLPSLTTPATLAPMLEQTQLVPATVEPNFDTLLADLMAVRTQKAELEKREKAITEALLKKFKEQKSQLEKLGITEPAPALKDEVKRVNLKKDDVKFGPSK